jgi:hypothetical protein
MTMLPLLLRSRRRHRRRLMLPLLLRSRRRHRHCGDYLPSSHRHCGDYLPSSHRHCDDRLHHRYHLPLLLPLIPQPLLLPLPSHSLPLLLLLLPQPLPLPLPSHNLLPLPPLHFQPPLPLPLSHIHHRRHHAYLLQTPTVEMSKVLVLTHLMPRRPLRLILQILFSYLYGRILLNI